MNATAPSSAALEPPGASPPAPSSLTPRLQVVYAWQRHLLGHRLLSPSETVTIGPAAGVTFAAPRLDGAPKRLALLRPIATGHRLRLLPGMTGWVETRGAGRQDITQILAQPAPKRMFVAAGARDVELGSGDCAVVTLDEAAKLRFQISYVDPPERVGRPNARRSEPFFFRVTSVTSVALGLLVVVMMLLSPADDPPTQEITAERLVEVVAPQLETPKMKVAQERAKQSGEKKKKEKEAAMSKKMKDKEGKLGRNDAKGETVMPKGEKDILRDKVAKVGVLSILGNVKAPGSGLGKLLDDSPSADLEQAVTGLEGAKVATAGRGSGGLGSAGTGLGGGGTGFGRIQGSGNFDVGAGRGRGRVGTGLGEGKEKTVSAGVDTGKPDSDGGLTADQIFRVVNAHIAALKYCYEKELQRKPDLAGKIELRWLIKPAGTVEQVGTASNTLGDKAVESCMQRQVKAWRFPKATSPTLVQKFPFMFKGGS